MQKEKLPEFEKKDLIITQKAEASEQINAFIVRINASGKQIFELISQIEKIIEKNCSIITQIDEICKQIDEISKQIKSFFTNIDAS